MKYTISSANLNLLEPGEKGRILSLSPPNTPDYQELTKLGITIGKNLIVLKRYPNLIVEVDQQKTLIPPHLSRNVRIRLFDSRSRYPPQSTATITSEALMTA